MVNYMVAVDGSRFSKAAFYTALFTLNPERDHLFIIAVAEKITTSHHGYITENLDQMMEEEEKQEKRSVLSLFRKLCEAKGLKNYTAILAVSNHAGEIICEQAEVKKIDFLLVGRRGMSKLHRVVVGSTSRYCLDHSPCNIIVVKGEWGPSEQHSEIKEISDLEESERKRRIRSDEKNIEENKKHREVVNEEIKKLVTEIETQVKEDKTEHPPHEEVRKTYS